MALKIQILPHLLSFPRKPFTLDGRHIDKEKPGMSLPQDSLITPVSTPQCLPAETFFLQTTSGYAEPQPGKSSPEGFTTAYLTHKNLSFLRNNSLHSITITSLFTENLQNSLAQLLIIMLSSSGMRRTTIFYC